MKHFTFLVVAIISVMPARAQLVEPNQIGVRMGHMHLAVKDVAEQRHFWVSVMRGTLGLDRPQAADLQPQTVNQRTVIGVAPPVMVVTLPVPFIRFFNAKKLVA